MRKVSLKRKVQKDTSDENESALNVDENGEDGTKIQILTIIQKTLKSFIFQL